MKTNPGAEPYKILLIGGTHDGEWIPLPEVPVIQMLATRPPPTFDKYIEDTHGFLKTETYENHRFRAGRREWSLYILSGLPIDVAFEKLLLCYQPKAAIQPQVVS